MSEKKNEGLQEKKKPGRKAMTPKEKEAAAKADFRAHKKRTLITSLKLYIKPEEQTAYYVVNEEYTGSVTF